MLLGMCLQLTLEFTPVKDVPALLSVDEGLCQEVAVLLALRFVACLRRLWGLDSDALVALPGGEDPNTAWINAAAGYFIAHRVVPSQAEETDASGLPSILRCVNDVRDEVVARIAVSHDHEHNQYALWMARLMGAKVELTVTDEFGFEWDTEHCCFRPLAPALARVLCFVICSGKCFYGAVSRGHSACAAFMAAHGFAPHPFDSRMLDTPTTHLSLPNVYATLAPYFAACKLNLTSLDLSECLGLTNLGHDFATQCPNLATVKLPRSLVTIESRFCSKSKLQSLDLSRCTELTRVGMDFLAWTHEASDLHTIDMHACVSLTTLSRRFAHGCKRLRCLFLPESVLAIPMEMVGECTQLTQINLSDCNNVRTIGDHFAEGCAQLASIELPVNVVSIGSYFCARCESLGTIDLSRCGNLKTIKRFFAWQCSALTRVDLSRCSALELIDEQFVRWCPNLRSLDFSACVALRLDRDLVAGGNMQVLTMPPPPGSRLTHHCDEFVQLGSSP